MKSVLLTCVCCIFFWQMQSQIVNIPDPAFKDCLLNNHTIDTNMDNEIQVSEALAYDGTIECVEMGITDATGIEAFENLTRLVMFRNYTLPSLDISNNTALTLLVAGRNALTSIDVSNNTLLDTLLVNVNQINTLNVTPLSNLKLLNIFDNPISEINLEQNPLLEELWVAVMPNMQELDLSNNPELKYLYCFGNLVLNQLDLRNGNNSAIIRIIAGGNSNLLCIDVDDPEYCETNWVGGNFEFDPWVIFSEDCSLSYEEVIATQFNIFPNPANKLLNINNEYDIEVNSIILYDTLGTKVLEKYKTSESIDISNLTPGIYFIHITTDRGAVTKKIIKE